TGTARDQRCEDSNPALETGCHNADRDADLGRLATVLVGRPGDRHQARLGLDHEVVSPTSGVGRIGAVAADRQVHEPRVERAERPFAEAEALEAAGPEVL